MTSILCVCQRTDETSQYPMRVADKPLYQTRPRTLDLLLPGFCLPAALARPSSIWSMWSAPRTATSPMCMPCVRVPVRTLLRIPGIRAGGGDVEAQSDRTSRPSPLEARQRPMGLPGPDPPIRPYPYVPCVYVLCMSVTRLPVYTCQSGRVWPCLLCFIQNGYNNGSARRE